jgi:hypothetical protein
VCISRACKFSVFAVGQLGSTQRTLTTVLISFSPRNNSPFCSQVVTQDFSGLEAQGDAVIWGLLVLRQSVTYLTCPLSRGIAPHPCV